MELWVVTAISCIDCNSMAVASFDHKPSEEEIQLVSASIGGMSCIWIKVSKTNVNGDPIEHNIHD